VSNGSSSGSQPADEVTVVPFGDSAVLALLGNRIDMRLNARAHALADRLRRLRVDDPRLGRPVPAHASVLLPYDCSVLGFAEVTALLADQLHQLLATEREPPEPTDDPPVFEIGVRYGGVDGPDLDAVAAALGLEPREVVELHSKAVYRVFMLGFAPGFAYLGPLRRRLTLPRRETPRIRVPAGSVAIASEQTAVYPSATAGGWHLIGRTEVSVWNALAEPPAALAPGRLVRFRPLLD